MNKVEIKHPKIHHSVLDRIADLKVGYAPTALPEEYHIVLHSGIVIDPAIVHTSYSETRKQQQQRANKLDRAKDHIFWRRFAYFSLLFATAIVLLIPHFAPAIPGLIPGAQDTWWTNVVGASLRYVAGYLPGFATYWTDAWSQSPKFFLIMLGVFLFVFVWSYWIQGNIRTLAEAGWWQVKGFTSKPYSRKPWPFEWFAGALRRSGVGAGIARLYGNYLLPFGFAGLCLALLAGTVYRLGWHYPYVMDGVCTLPRAMVATLSDGTTEVDTDKEAAPLDPGITTDITFATTTPCFNTGIELEAGRRYRVALAPDPSWGGGEIDWDKTDAHGKSRMEQSFLSSLSCSPNPPTSWRDISVPATPKGFVCFWDNFKRPFPVAIPARRHLSLPWFGLVGEIGIDSGTVFPLNRRSFEFVPETTGTLYLYVNDGIHVPRCPIWVWDGICRYDPTTWDWDRYYRNNKGGAMVKITKVKL